METAACERCGAPFDLTQPHRRFCTRRCQMNAYHEHRKQTDLSFHERALEYQRLYRIRERARQLTDPEQAAATW
jgi:hypothetical protein